MKVTVESKQDFKGTEFIFSVEGINTPICGRITEILNETKERPFSWQISHYYSPVPGGIIHSPSAVNGHTFDEAYQLMTGYLDNMSEPLEENDRY